MRQYLWYMLVGSLAFWAESCLEVSAANQQAPLPPQAPSIPLSMEKMKAPVDCKCSQDRSCGGACGSFCFCSPQKPEEQTSCECEGRYDCICSASGCRCSACLEKKEEPKIEVPPSMAGYEWKQLSGYPAEFYLFRNGIQVGKWDGEVQRYRDYSNGSWSDPTTPVWKREQTTSDPFISSPISYQVTPPVLHRLAIPMFSSMNCNH